jgi:hypothetical protein
MIVVAVAELAHPVDLEAQRLAEDIGVTAYEMRITLMAGFPAIVLTTVDRELARRVLERIVSRGNSVVGCDERQVIESENMIPLRRFSLDPDAIRTAEHPDASLPYGDVLAVIRATHRKRTDTTTVTRHRTFNPGRAILTGGLMMTGTKKTETTTRIEERENVAYLFRRSGERPWIVRQDEAKYQGLRGEMQQTNTLNFTRMLGKLRELVPTATFDTRLMSVKRVPERSVDMGVSPTGNMTMSSTHGVDLLAHLLALYFAQRDASSPYRR